MSQTRILVVEDENIVALDMVNRLKSFGYQVVDRVGNGRDAIKVAQEAMPDAILMDIQLKGDIDGVEAAETIRQTVDIPVIYITAYADNDTLDRAKVTEAFGYLIKPYNDRELYTNIEVALYKHKMEKRVRKSERWLDITLNSIADGVIAADSSDNVRFLNPAAEKLTGYTLEQSKGKPLDAVFVLSRDRELEKRMQPEIGGDQVKNYLLHSREGDIVPIEVTRSSIMDETNNDQGVVYVFHNVSERRRFEFELQEAKEKAESANRAKNAFLANMTHELRTPLNSIIGMADLAIDSAENPELREYLRIIRESGGSLLSLINSILDYSRFEAGKAATTEASINLDTFIKEIVERFRETLEKKKLDLNVRIRPHTTLALRGDKKHLDQVISHLIENAIKFTEEGHIDVVIHEESTDNNRSGSNAKYYHFTVQDTGIGLPREDSEKIFNAFTQLDDSYTRSYGGAGLGLSLVKNIVELMGGKIWVVSENGSGSEFHVVLPFLLQDQAKQTREKVSYTVHCSEPLRGEELTSSRLDSFHKSLSHLQELATHRKYDELEMEATRLKDECHGIDKELSNGLFKLILAIRKGAFEEVHTMLDSLETLCHDLLKK